VIDLEGLVEQIDLISSRYVDEITRDWDRQLQRYFVDLRKDPRPLSAPYRPANTNGSILLDKYAYFATSEAVHSLGWQQVMTLIALGVVTEGDPLFRSSQ
jgi:hypothetical protein